MLFSDCLTGMSVNAALNQPAYQATTWIPQYASSANDGNYSTVSCTNSYTGMFWWAVDLSQPKFVRGVNVTNDVSVQYCKMPVFLAIMQQYVNNYSSHHCFY